MGSGVSIRRGRAVWPLVRSNDLRRPSSKFWNVGTSISSIDQKSKEGQPRASTITAALLSPKTKREAPVPPGNYWREALARYVTRRRWGFVERVARRAKEVEG